MTATDGAGSAFSYMSIKEHGWRLLLMMIHENVGCIVMLVVTCRHLIDDEY